MNGCSAASDIGINSARTISPRSSVPIPRSGEKREQAKKTNLGEGDQPAQQQTTKKAKFAVTVGAAAQGDAVAVFWSDETIKLSQDAAEFMTAVSDDKTDSQELLRDPAKIECMRRYLQHVYKLTRSSSPGEDEFEYDKLDARIFMASFMITHEEALPGPGEVSPLETDLRRTAFAMLHMFSELLHHAISTARKGISPEISKARPFTNLLNAYSEAFAASKSDASDTTILNQLRNQVAEKRGITAIVGMVTAHDAPSIEDLKSIHVCVRMHVMIASVLVLVGQRCLQLGKKNSPALLSTIAENIISSYPRSPHGDGIKSVVYTVRESLEQEMSKDDLSRLMFVIT